MVSAFRANLRANPTLDAEGHRSAILKRQSKGYRDKDPAPNHQACLPLIVWKSLHKLQRCHFTTAIGQLIIGALFFGMRSCEYSSVNDSDGKRKTKRLELQNISFFSKHKDGFIVEIPHSAPETDLIQAECVSVTFVDQKNGEKMCTITQHRTTNPAFCPVHAWGSLVKRVRGYPKATDSTPVNTFWDHKKKKCVLITSTQVRNHLRTAVKSVGAKRLGVQLNRIGTHTIRTSFAMLLYLANVRTSTIMLIGRWKSDAFLLYLRKNIKEFTEGVTSSMLSQPDVFFSLTSTNSGNNNDLPHRQLADRDDPRVPHADSISSAPRFNGPGNRKNTSSAATPHFIAPALRIWG